MLSHIAVQTMYWQYTHKESADAATEAAREVWDKETLHLSGDSFEKKVNKLKELAAHEPHPRFQEFVASLTGVHSRGVGLRAAAATSDQRLVLQRETPRERIIRLLDVSGRALNQSLEALDTAPDFAIGKPDPAVLVRVRHRLADVLRTHDADRIVHQLMDDLLNSGVVSQAGLMRAAQWLDCGSSFLSLEKIRESLLQESGRWLANYEAGRPTAAIAVNEVTERARAFLHFVCLIEPFALPNTLEYPGIEDAFVAWLAPRMQALDDEIARINRSSCMADLFGRYLEEGEKAIHGFAWTDPVDKEAALAYCAITHQIVQWQEELKPQIGRLVLEETRTRLDRKLQRAPGSLELLQARSRLLSAHLFLFDEALIDANRCVELAPKAANLLDRAIILACLKRPGDAMADIGAALRDQEVSLDRVLKLYSLRASLLGEASRPWEAMGDAHRARACGHGIVLQPELESILIAQERAAWSEFLLSLEGRSAPWLAKLGEGREMLLLGNFARAGECFSRVLEANGENQWAKVGLQVTEELKAFKPPALAMPQVTDLAQRNPELLAQLAAQGVIPEALLREAEALVKDQAADPEDAAARRL